MKIAVPVPKRSRVEMIPLIDMIFLLLASFVFAFIAMTVHKGIPVNLPFATTFVEDQEEYISVTVTENDEIYIDKMKIERGELIGLLKEIKRKDPEARIYLSADKDTTYKQIVFVLDALRNVGLQRVSLETGDIDE
ncbi:MAG: biopolymer transporter ExbD [Candidatus Omnitrophota bacterium]